MKLYPGATVQDLHPFNHPVRLQILPSLFFIRITYLRHTFYKSATSVLLPRLRSFRSHWWLRSFRSPHRRTLRSFLIARHRWSYRSTHLLTQTIHWDTESCTYLQIIDISERIRT